MDIKRYKYSSILLHVLIWSLLAFMLLSYPHTLKKEVNWPPEFITKQVVHLGIILIAYYFNAYFLVQKTLLKKKYFQFVLGIIGLTLFAAFFMTFVSRMLDLHTKLPFANIPTIWHKLYLDRFATWTTLIVIGISTLLSIMSKWNADSKKLETLEKEKIQSELSALRAQIHPHFLFNTLNTVYALSFVDSEASRKALAQVSRLLRYQLYEVQQGETSLEKELTFIRDYVEIMRLRVNEKINVNLELPENVASKNIAPMILICYIENVFKHGITQGENENLYISIALKEKILQLTTKNKIASTVKTTLDETSGIGMQNTQRRLELLYPGRHEISINKDSEQNEFELQLTLQLS